MRDIFISSLAMTGKSVEEMILEVKRNNWAFEFSSGMPYRSDMEEMYLKAPVIRMPHNYFPAPQVPFVINLASKNVEIRNLSIAHCKKGLWLAKQSNSPFFAAHAGFCVDPHPSDLGKKLNFSPDFTRDENKEIFIESVLNILDKADELGVDFLVENNVIAPFNLINQNINPLLCCESEEIKWMVKEVSHPRLGLLLDTAHLKVSCKTLELNLKEELHEILPHTKGVHHSDNNGLVDDNQPMMKDYWFLQYIREVKNLTHVIEVRGIDTNTINQQINLILENGY